MGDLFYIIIFTTGSGIISLLGGLFLLWREKFTRRIIIPLISFAAGIMIATAFFDILPEALEEMSDAHETLQIVMIGFITFFILEKILRGLHPDHHQESHHGHTAHISKTPSLLVLGDTLHNFLDGLIIAAAFITDIRLGIITTMAVAAHEIPQEIGEFSVLLHAGWRKVKIIALNILSSVSAVLGAIIVYLNQSLLEPYFGGMLAFTAGVFIYIAASDLIPEVTHHEKKGQLSLTIISFLIGIAIMFFVGEALH